MKLMYSVTNITKLFILKQLCRYFGAMRRYCFFVFVKTFVLYVLLKLICQTSRERVASGGIIAIINGLRDLSRVFHYNYWLFSFLSCAFFLFLLKAKAESASVKELQNRKSIKSINNCAAGKVFLLQKRRPPNTGVFLVCFDWNQS